MARAPHLRQNPAEPVTQAATPSRAVKTRERLLEHAIRLFARHGLEGVSLRTVMQSAGAKNTAAVHYHFGDRETLVLAAVDLIVASITTTVSKAEAAVLGILLDPDPQDVRAILESELLPLLTLPHRKPWGADAIKLLARIIMGEARQAAPRLEDSTISASRGLLDRLARHLPDVPREIVQMRVEFAYVNLICGMAAIPYLDAIEEAGLTVTPSSAQLANGLLDYVAGGLAAPVVH